MWKNITCHLFQSIWWGDNGNCVVIAEKLFQKEALGRRRARILDAGMRRSRNADKRVISADFEPLLFYPHPYFQRDHPNLLKMEMVAESAGERLGAVAAAPMAPTWRTPP
ncbi:PREDICTED: heat shock transcription factor, X-linked-like [Nestor notabilis]|uniref:heat shock transcription factor, X-linked-like n=1 Tax=Nestor notabilis TaxID=176057 RepID=UPI00052358AD|nr:PREDICTED: heat shock transcription factor, X-linked-like [Nestor notabilis]